MNQSTLLSSDKKNPDEFWTLNGERVNQLNRGVPAAIAGNFILAVILIYIQHPAVVTHLLIAWLSAMILVLTIRAFTFYQYNIQRTPIDVEKQLNRFRVVAILTGLVWASAPAFLFPENDIALQATLSFVLAGVSAGAASSLSVDKVSSIGFIAPPLLSLTTAFLNVGQKESLAMALMTALFLGFIIFSCVRSERQFRENVNLRSVALQREAALSNSEARLRNLFDLSPFGIILNDYEAGNTLEVNDRLIELCGYSKDEFIRLGQWDITPREYKSQELSQRETLILTGRYGPYEKELIRKDETRFPVLLNGVLIVEANGRKLIWSIVEDISDRKRIEKLKSEFISTVSHELRTPLTAISGAIGLLSSHFTEGWPEPMQNMLRIARSNSERLTQLINDLLDIEKITSGKMVFNLQQHSLLPLVRQAVEINRPYAFGYGVKLLVSEESVNAEVLVDPPRLQQILANLFSNAIKFSTAGESVSVLIQHTNNDAVRINVIDLGPGIPEDFRDRIFQKFSQADSSDSRAKGGTGLGLAITKELAEKMNGAIGFESIEGKGSTFWIELLTVIDDKASF